MYFAIKWGINFDGDYIIQIGFDGGSCKVSLSDSLNESLNRNG